MPRLNKSTAKERALKVAKGLRKHKGNASALARELGVSPQAIAKKKNNPEFQSLRQQAIAKASQRAGFTLDKIYSVLADGLKATEHVTSFGEMDDTDLANYRERREHAKIGLELFEHLGGDLVQDAKPTEINVYYGHRKHPPKKDDDGT